MMASRKPNIEGAKPGKQTYLGYRQFSGAFDASAVRDFLIKVATGEAQHNQKDGYNILETARLVSAHFGNLVAKGKIPAGKKYLIEKYIGKLMDDAALVEIAIRYESKLLERLYSRNRMLLEDVEDEQNQLAIYAEGWKRGLAGRAACWMEAYDNIAKLRTRGESDLPCFL